MSVITARPNGKPTCTTTFRESTSWLISNVSHEHEGLASSLNSSMNYHEPHSSVSPPGAVSRPDILNLRECLLSVHFVFLDLFSLFSTNHPRLQHFTVIRRTRSTFRLSFHFRNFLDHKCWVIWFSIHRRELWLTCLLEATCTFLVDHFLSTTPFTDFSTHTPVGSSGKRG